MYEHIYSSEFYQGQAPKSHLSASCIVPLLMSLLQPESVVDFGCGGGGWIAEFLKKGCRVIGVDGDYVPRNQLLIPEELFVAADMGENALSFYETRMSSDVIMQELCALLEYAVEINRS